MSVTLNIKYDGRRKYRPELSKVLAEALREQLAAFVTIVPENAMLQPNAVLLQVKINSVWGPKSEIENYSEKYNLFFVGQYSTFLHSPQNQRNVEIIKFLGYDAPRFRGSIIMGNSKRPRVCRQ